MPNRKITTIRNTQKARDSRLEVLRIVSMILIIVHHYSVHGGFNLAESALTINKFLVQLFSLGGKIGVICFVLITGYFMISSSFKFKKLLKLILEVWFYSIGIMLIFVLFGHVELNTELLVKSLLPITHSAYWFVTAYVVLYLLSPVINKLLHTITQKQCLILLSILFVLISLVPTILIGSVGFGNVGLFIFIYMIAAYIHLYPNSFKGWLGKSRENTCLALLSCGLLVLSVILFDLIGTSINIQIMINNATYFASLTSPIALFCGIFIFLSFKNSHMKNSKFINQIALSMFGVYLIHDNIFIKQLLWQNIFQNATYFTSPWLILHTVNAILITFVGCTIIDQARIFLLEKPLFKIIDKIEYKYSQQLLTIKEKYNKIVEHLL